jgi:uncharacterized protein (TIGR03790 family)
VIENLNSMDSIEIAQDYVRKRGIKNVLEIKTQDSSKSADKETITYENFLKEIEKPLKERLAAKKGINYIVLTKGIPLRIQGAKIGIQNNRPSVDSYITALDYPVRKDVINVVLNDSGFTGKCWVNRYWDAKEPFTHEKFGGYLVSRLDGYTVAQAKALTTNALKAEMKKQTGSFLIDAQNDHKPEELAKVPIFPNKEGSSEIAVFNEMSYGDWDADLIVAADRLTKAGFTVTLNKENTFVTSADPVLGYASWGSNDGKYNADNYHALKFAPGAIAETAVSTSARTFLPTTGGQSLIADLIKQGVTGVKGYCDEPLLQAVASPTVMFDHYVRGFTLAESFYAASRFVGWEDIVVGDPLCRAWKAK